MWLWLAILGCTGPQPADSGSLNGDSGDTGNDAPPGEVTLEALGAPVPRGPYLLRTVDGVWVSDTEGAWRSTDDGATWDLVDRQDGVAAVLEDGRRIYATFDPSVGLTGSYDYFRIEADNSRTELPSPWEDVDVAGIRVAASGSVLWAVVDWRSDPSTIAPARVYRIDATDAEWTQVTPPDGEAISYLIEPDGEGGVWLTDLSYSPDSYKAWSTADGSSWTEVASNDISTVEVRHLTGDTWLRKLRRTDDTVIERSTDDGATWTEVGTLSPAGLLRTWGGRALWFSAVENTVSWTDDAGETVHTWTTDEPLGEYSDMLPIDGGVLGIIGEVPAFWAVHGPGWRVRTLPAGHKRQYTGIQFVGDTGVAVHHDLRSGAIKPRVFWTDDGGETWGIGPQEGGEALCGGSTGWFLALGTSFAAPTGGGSGMMWAHLSADGRTRVADGITEELNPPNGILGGGTPQRVRISTLGGAPIDCSWSDAQGGTITLSVSDLDNGTGVLLDGFSTGSFTYRNPELYGGDATPSRQMNMDEPPTAVIADDALFSSGGGSGFLLDGTEWWPTVWREASWETESDRTVGVLVAHDQGWVGAENGKVGIALGKMNETFVLNEWVVNGWPDPLDPNDGPYERLNDLAHGPSNHLWLASNQGLFKSTAPTW